MNYQLNSSKFLSEPELKELERLIEKYNNRDTLALELLLRTGARAQELLNCTVKDFNRGALLIRGLKGSDDREIPLHPKVQKKVQDYIKTLGQDGPLFDFSYVYLFRIWSMYRPVRKKLHSLRHTFAIELYKKRRDVRLVQVALGHRNIQNTMVYADYTYKLEEMRKLLW